MGVDTTFFGDRNVIIRWANGARIGLIGDHVMRGRESFNLPVIVLETGIVQNRAFFQSIR